MGAWVGTHESDSMWVHLITRVLLSEICGNYEVRTQIRR